MSGCRVPWWDQPGGAFGDVNVDWSCFSFVYFDGAVEVEVFVKEFFVVDLDLYKTF